MYSFFRLIRRLWVQLGEPFPGMVRAVRYTVLGRWWPVTGTAMPVRIQPVHTTRPALCDVAVIIPCHNYGRFLAEAVESALGQTRKPAEILIVDDFSTDDTRNIAEKYRHKGVHYLRVQYGSLAKTRNAGAGATRSPYLLYLDADDQLSPQYIERCIAQIDTGVGLVYGDRAQFGEKKLYIHAPEFSEELLARENFISSHALIQRQAFDMVGGYRQIDGSLEDWDFYRRVIAAGYTARHAHTSVRYRMHKDSMGYLLRKDPTYSYARSAALAHHPVTLATVFSGRRDVFDAYLKGIISLDILPEMLHLHWYNTSQDLSFDTLLRSKVASLPFSKITYTHAPYVPLTEDAAYTQELIMTRAYTDIIHATTTDYLMTVEDTIQIQPSTLRFLQQAMTVDVVAVAASISQAPVVQSGIQKVGVLGFVCTLFRTHALRSISPLSTGLLQQPSLRFTQIASHNLRGSGTLLCHGGATVNCLSSSLL